MAKKENIWDINEIPRTKAMITKNKMLDYIKTKGTKADKEWFQKTVADLLTTKTNSLNNTTVKTVDIKKLRDEFINRFFKTYFMPKAKNTDEFFDMVDKLI